MGARPVGRRAGPGIERLGRIHGRPQEGGSVGKAWQAVAMGAAIATAGCVSYRGDGFVRPSVDKVQSEVALRAQTGQTLAVPSTRACGDPVVDALLAQPLTQESAVRVALLNNRSVRESYERLGIARADLLQAGLLSNPVFTADAKFFSAGPEIELGLARSFLDLFFIPLRRSVARADLAAEEAAVTRDLVRLAYDVRRAFVVVHAADGMVAMRQEALQAAEASRDLMLKLHAAGNALDTRRTIEEVGASRSRLELNEALAFGRDAREPLNVLLGLQGTPPAWTIAGGMSDPPADAPPSDVVAKARTASLDLLENCARIRSAMLRAGLVRREGAWPALDLGVVAKRENEGGWGAGPAISTTLPIFDQGQAKFLEANATLRSRVAHHVQLTVEVEAAARRLSARVEALRERSAYLRDVYLPLRERLVEETLQFFNAMQIGAFDVLNAKQQQMDAKREFIETVRDAWLVSLDLKELLAGSLNPMRLDPMPMPDEAEHPDAPKGH
jgi:outer membrane protein, heavy metal efflux system